MFLMFVLSSIGCLCIETVPALRVPIPGRAKKYGFGVTVLPGTSPPTINRNNSSGDVTYKLSSEQYVFSNITTPPPTVDPDAVYMTNPKIRSLMETQPHAFLENIDTFCTCFFTVEFLVRLIVAPNRIKFWKSIMNIIDVLCVMPMWIKYIMMLYDIQMNMRLLPLFFLIMMLRVLRICRVLRLARHYTGVKILLLALKASFRELFMLVLFVFIVVLIFSVSIYYAEFFIAETFQTIPDGYWWAIITLTTVGYGDMYPQSGLGYVVGSLCALTGILATGLPVPIIANNFNIYYGHAQMKEAVRNRKYSRRPSAVSEKENSSITNAKSEPYIVKEATV